MKICPKCGNKNLDEASFCESCGAEIKDVTPVRYEYPNENKRTIIETKVDLFAFNNWLHCSSSFFT